MSFVPHESAKFQLSLFPIKCNKYEPMNITLECQSSFISVYSADVNSTIATNFLVLDKNIVSVALLFYCAINFLLLAKEYCDISNKKISMLHTMTFTLLIFINWLQS